MSAVSQSYMGWHHTEQHPLITTSSCCHAHINMNGNFIGEVHSHNHNTLCALAGLRKHTHCIRCMQNAVDVPIETASLKAGEYKHTFWYS